MTSTVFFPGWNNIFFLISLTASEEQELFSLAMVIWMPDAFGSFEGNKIRNFLQPRWTDCLMHYGTFYGNEIQNYLNHGGLTAWCILEHSRGMKYKIFSNHCWLTNWCILEHSRGTKYKRFLQPCGLIEMRSGSFYLSKIENFL